jgi:hypothetical protein
MEPAVSAKWAALVVHNILALHKQLFREILEQDLCDQASNSKLLVKFIQNY